MNPTINTLKQAPPTADQGAAPAAVEDGYEAVTGLDKETVALKRSYEAEVEAKVASDYSHIVWAYGILWSLFCGFAVALLVRGARQQRDLRALRRELDARGAQPVARP